jgi:hypothetical protein
MHQAIKELSSCQQTIRLARALRLIRGRCHNMGVFGGGWSEPSPVDTGSMSLSGNALQCPVLERVCWARDPLVITYFHLSK